MAHAATKSVAMVVDDEEGMRTLARRILESQGYCVLEARDGVEALRALDETAPCDLLVADLQMPAMQGDEMARRFRAARPDLKVLYVSAFSDLLFENRQVLCDQEAFLDKPYTSNGLTEAVSLLMHPRPPEAPRTSIRDMRLVW